MGGAREGTRRGGAAGQGQRSVGGIWSDTSKGRGLETVWERVHFMYLREERETGIPKEEGSWAPTELIREES